MKLFINKGMFERNESQNVEIRCSLGKPKIKIMIPNYVEKRKKHEEIIFSFLRVKEVKKESIEKGMLIKDIEIRRMDDNSYIITEQKSEVSNEKCIYALLKNSNIVPDDIYIPAAMKDKVQVIKRMRFADSEVDYGYFLSNVYFVKITLSENESIPFYLTYSDSKVLTDHVVFYKNDYDGQYYVKTGLKTYILIAKDEFVSLSSLCK